MKEIDGLLDDECQASYTNDDMEIKLYRKYLLLNDTRYEIPYYIQSKGYSNLKISGGSITINGYNFDVKSGTFKSNDTNIIMVGLTVFIVFYIIGIILAEYVN